MSMTELLPWATNMVHMLPNDYQTNSRDLTLTSYHQVLRVRVQGLKVEEAGLLVCRKSR
jgi:hypothetical protein